MKPVLSSLLSKAVVVLVLCLSPCMLNLSALYDLTSFIATADFVCNKAKALTNLKSNRSKGMKTVSRVKGVIAASWGLAQR